MPAAIELVPELQELRDRLAERRRSIEEHTFVRFRQLPYLEAIDSLIEQANEIEPDDKAGQALFQQAADELLAADFGDELEVNAKQPETIEATNIAAPLKRASQSALGEAKPFKSTIKRLRAELVEHQRHVQLLVAGHEGDNADYPNIDAVDEEELELLANGFTLLGNGFSHVKEGVESLNRFWQEHAQSNSFWNSQYARFYTQARLTADAALTGSDDRISLSNQAGATYAWDQLQEVARELAAMHKTQSSTLWVELITGESQLTNLAGRLGELHALATSASEE